LGSYPLKSQAPTHVEVELGCGKKIMFRIQSQDKRAGIRMLVTVVIAFFSCWSPFHSQRLMFVLVTLYGRWNRSLTRAQHVLFMVSGTS
jgi:hypothetical protein